MIADRLKIANPERCCGSLFKGVKSTNESFMLLHTISFDAMNCTKMVIGNKYISQSDRCWFVNKSCFITLIMRFSYFQN